MEYYVPRYISTIQKTIPMQNVRKASIHNRVIDIDNEAFCDWINLKEVVFETDERKENQLRRIGYRAFAGTALEELKTPRLLRSIEAGAFARCSNLRTVKLNEGLESIGGEGEGAF